MCWHPRECRVCEACDEDGRAIGQPLEDDGTCPVCERSYEDPSACYVCGEEAEPRDLEEVLEAPPQPLLSDFEQWLEITAAELGTDAHGRPLVTEQLALLDEHGITRPEDRRIVRRLWAASLGAASAERLRRIEETRNADNQ